MFPVSLPQDRRQMCLNCTAIPHEWHGKCPVCGYDKAITIAPENALRIKTEVMGQELYGELYIEGWEPSHRAVTEAL